MALTKPRLTVTWVPIPAGRTADGLLAVTAFVSFRIEAAATLADIPDLLDWPAIMNGEIEEHARIHFQAQLFTPNPTNPDDLSSPVGDPLDALPAPGATRPDSALWRQVFQPSLHVDPYVPPTTRPPQEVVRSFAASRIIEQVQHDTAAHTSTAPKLRAYSISPALSAYAQQALEPQFPNLQAHASELVTEIFGHHPPDTFVFPADVAVKDYVKNTTNAARFFSRPIDGDARHLPPPTPWAHDFHQIVALLGSYPELLRRLGLAFDLVVDPSQLEGQPDAIVQLIPDFTSVFDLDPSQGRTVSLNPGALADVRPGRFRAKPRPLDVDPHTGTYTPTDRAGRPVAPLYPDFDGGYLELDNANVYSVGVLDDVHAALQTQAIQGTTGGDGAVDVTAPPPGGALRTGGFTIAHFNRAVYLSAVHLERLFDLQAALDAATASPAASAGDPPYLVAGPTMFLEDLTRGFRVDVHRDDDARWRSLMQRDVTFAVGSGDAASTFTHSDEAAVSLSLVRNPHADDNSIYLHENLFRWMGWSLAAPPPGKALLAPGHPEEPAGYVAGADSALDDVGLAVSTKATDGTLPALRFGRSYRFRARLADLAGGGPTLGDADESHVTASTVFARYEPVPSPPLALQSPLTRAETVERVVIRSNFAGAPDATPTAASRHIAAPKSSQLMSELHGAFDDSSGRPAVASYGVAARESKSLLDVAGASQGGGDPKTALIPASSFTTPYLPDRFAPGVALANLPGATQVVTVPFSGAWPDLGSVRLQLAAGTGAPTVSGSVLTALLPPATQVDIDLSCFLRDGDIDVLGVWQWLKDLQSATPVRTLAATGQLDALTPSRTLTLVHAVRQPLQRPDLANVSVALVVQEQQPFNRGQTQPPPKAVTFSGRAAGSTTVDLIGRIDVDRPSTAHVDLLATWIDHNDSLASRGPTLDPAHATVAKLHVDDPALHPMRSFSNPESDVTTSVAVVGLDDTQSAKSLVIGYVRVTTDRRPIDQAEPPTIRTDFRYELVPVVTQDFHDTKHRYVTYDAVATSAFSTYFDTPTSRRLTLSGTTPATLDAHGVQQVEVVSVPSGDSSPKTFVESIDPNGSYGDYVVDQVRGTVVRTPHSTIDQGEDVLVSWIPLVSRASDVPDQGDATASRSASMHVPSTARPAVPKALYAIPTFAWSSSSGGFPLPTVSSNRVGGGLRVYLDRPWYSSGQDEVLAVVLGSSPAGGYFDPNALATDFTDDGARRTQATTWGNDPLWWSPALPGQSTTTRTLNDSPSSDHFSQADKIVRGVPHPEATKPPDSSGNRAPVRVDLATYAVAFDPDRRLWYADVVIDQGASYLPFVRLALARYQPYSLPGLELSPIHMLDYVQLAPDRAATVTKLSPGTRFTPGVVSVSVTGPAYTRAMDESASPKNTAGPGDVLVDVEVRLDNGPSDPDLRWTSLAVTQKLAVRLNTAPGLLGQLTPARSATWSGTVNLHANLATQHVRLVLREVNAHGQTIYVDTIELS